MARTKTRSTAARSNRADRGKAGYYLSIDSAIIERAKALPKSASQLNFALSDQSEDSEYPEDIARLKLNITAHTESEAKDLLKIAAAYCDAVRQRDIHLSPTFSTKTTNDPAHAPVHALRDGAQVEIDLADILADGLDELAGQITQTTTQQLPITPEVYRKIELTVELLDKRSNLEIYTFPATRTARAQNQNRQAYTFFQGHELAIPSSALRPLSSYSLSQHRTLILEYLKNRHLQLAKDCLARLRRKSQLQITIPTSALDDYVIFLDGERMVLNRTNLRRLLCLAYFQNARFNVTQYSELYGNQSGYPAKEFGTNCSELGKVLGIKGQYWLTEGRNSSRRIDCIKWDTDLTAAQIKDHLEKA